MGTLENKLSLTLYLVLLFLFFSASRADFRGSLEISTDNVIGDAACKIVDCGQGTCNASADDKPPFFFECECYPGWTQLKPLGLVTFPPCIIPNCTVNFDCAPPPLPPLVLPTNLSDPCNFTWCGNGTCVHNDAGGHTCNCNDGAYNLLNLPGMPCFKECYLGSDCNGVGFGSPPPPLLPPPSPPGTSDGSGGPTKFGSGSNKARKWSGALWYMVFLMSLLHVI